MKKHRSTLQAIFAEPSRANVNWKDVEAMLAAFGAEISEGKGSRVRIALNQVRAVFHRPHPQKETDKGALRSMRRFLTEACPVSSEFALIAIAGGQFNEARDRTHEVAAMNRQTMDRASGFVMACREAFPGDEFLAGRGQGA